MVENYVVPDGWSADDIIAANRSRAQFSAAVWKGRVGRHVQALDVRQAHDATAIFSKQLSELNDKEGLYIVIDTQGEETEITQLLPISEPAALDAVLTEYEGGFGNIHLHALPIDVVAEQWRYGEMKQINQV